jgi:large repetitive protein
MPAEIPSTLPQIGPANSPPVASDQIRVIAQSNIIFNGSSSTRGSFISTGSFTFNGSSTLYGNIAAKGNITFNGTSTVVGANIVTPVVNQTPSDLRLSNVTIAENNAAKGLVGTFSTTDQNSRDLHTYQLVTGTGSTDNAVFSIVNNQLVLNARPDFETKESYSVRVRVSERSGLSTERVLTIGVMDVNEAPSDIVLSNQTILENNRVNALVGIFSTVDSDRNDTFSYQLVSGAGDTDNHRFIIQNNELRLVEQADFERKSSYSIRVQVTDALGQLREEILTIQVRDQEEAPISISLT